MQLLLSSNNIKLKIEGLWTPRAQRKHDTIIMDYVVQNLPAWTWDPINTCRLYLQAITFSDITSFDGKWIQREIYQVMSPIRKSWLQYPKQKKRL